MHHYGIFNGSSHKKQNAQINIISQHASMYLVYSGSVDKSVMVLLLQKCHSKTNMFKIATYTVTLL